jgi:hypothetical protein
MYSYRNVISFPRAVMCHLVETVKINRTILCEFRNCKYCIQVSFFVLSEFFFNWNTRCVGLHPRGFLGRVTY